MRKTAFLFIFVLTALTTCKVRAQELTVPGIGSTWSNRVVYLSSGREQAPEVIRVTRMQDGRPVFAGETFGYQGEIMETSLGMVISTQDCLPQIPADQTLPPSNPNQCSWGLCVAPKVGQTIERPIFLYAALYGCKLRMGVYRYTATGVAMSKEYGEVTVGDAEMTFGFFARTKWESHIAPGMGEVFSQSTGRETRYDLVQVHAIRYKANGLTQAANAAPVAANADTLFRVDDGVQRDCQIVAFGDSLTEGMGVRQHQCYPAILEGIGGMKVCNFGNAGNTSEIGVQRLHEVIEAKPKLVIVIFGANDALRGVSGAAIQASLEKIVDGLHAAGIAVVLGGLHSEDAVRTVPAWRELIDIHDAVAKTRPWIRHIPDVTEGVIGRPEMTSSDALHPNAAGYARIAQTIWQQGVKPWVESLKIMATN